MVHSRSRVPRYRYHLRSLNRSNKLIIRNKVELTICSQISKFKNQITNVRFRNRVTFYYILNTLNDAVKLRLETPEVSEA